MLLFVFGFVFLLFQSFSLVPLRWYTPTTKRCGAFSLLRYERLPVGPHTTDVAIAPGLVCTHDGRTN
eukprot:gene3717-2616_t